MKIDFSVDYMKILESDEDTALVELDLLHTGRNRNQYVINRDVVEKAIPTIYNKPIIYRLNNEFIPDMATDVVEHGTLEDRTMRIAGTIPESAPMEFIERDGKEYLRTKGVIYKIYQPSLMNILETRNGNMKVSIEIYVTDKDEAEDGGWIINEFKFEGVALLGETIMEGIEGSQMNVIKFSAQDLNEHYLKFSHKETSLGNNEGEKVVNSMKNISAELLREKIHDYLRQIAGDDDRWRYWIGALYIEPKQVVVTDDDTEKSYLVEYMISDEGEISLLWDTKREIVRCYIPIDEVTDSTLIFKHKEILSLTEDGQLISNAHRLSSVDSDEARKAEILLNSLEKEEEKVDENEVKNACGEEVENTCGENTANACGEEVENCGDAVKNAANEAEKVEDEEEKEDEKEDEKEEKDEDFSAKFSALEAENAELKASLEVYKRKEELASMNALIEEFSYCFTDAEKDELVKSLDTKTFAEVESVVNESVRKFAKENKPKEEENKEEKFSLGLFAKSFAYKKEDKSEVNTLKDITNKYSNK